MVSSHVPPFLSRFKKEQAFLKLQKADAESSLSYLIQWQRRVRSWITGGLSLLMSTSGIFFMDPEDDTRRTKRKKDV